MLFSSERSSGAMLSAQRPAITALSASLQSKSSIELVYTPARIDEFLLAGIKRVAFGADFYLYVFFCAAGLNNLSTGAPYDGRSVVRVYSLFHFVHLAQNSRVFARVKSSTSRRGLQGQIAR
jgi:hypothetical protein